MPLAGGVAMLQIAICDDQPRELEIINSYITEYLVIHKLEAEINKFFYPDNLNRYMNFLMAKEVRR
jgi:hypothetical protein